MLTQGEVEKFKSLVLEIYGKQLTNEEAENQGSRLIQLFELILKKEKEAINTINSEQKVVQNEYR